MNPESSPADGANAWLATGVPPPPLTDDELFAYASEDFDLVDPRQIELELARDPVARHRLRQIEAQVLARRDAEVFEGLANRVAKPFVPAASFVPAEARAGIAAASTPTPTLADRIASLGIQITLHVRRLSDSLDALESAGGWRLLPESESAMPGLRSADSASGRPATPRALHFRDRSHNRITLAHSTEGCDIGVLLISAPRHMTILALAQTFDPKAPESAPARTAVVKDNAALFNDCPAGLYHLTGVEGLDIWIRIDPD